jgi:ATP-dependent DNA helicase RecG
MSSEQLINSLLKIGESEQLEFKVGYRKDVVGKNICAFLNSNGGQLLIGVTDEGKIKGVPNAVEHQKVIENHLKQEIVPDAPVTVTVENIGKKNLILLKVWAGSKQPYVYDSTIYCRKGSWTVKATSDDISKLIRNRQATDLHWERQLALGVGVDDLDHDEINKTIVHIGESEKLGEDDSVVNFLTNYGLFYNGQPTNSAVILFAKNPTRFVPQSRVRLSFLENGKTDDKFLDDKILEGNLFKNIDVIQGFFEKHLSKTSQFDKADWQRKDSYAIPMPALREGVLNALVHRDYSSSSASISIIIYSDKIEISNSGKSPLKANELKKNHLSMPVNPDIAHIVFLRGYIEKMGRGTLKVIDACKKQGLKVPLWKTSDTGVKLTFYPKKNLVGANVGANVGAVDGVIESIFVGATDTTKKNLSMLLQVVLGHEGRRMPEYSNIVDIGSDRTVERYMQQLRDADLLYFKGEATQSGGYYATDKLNKLIDKIGEK